MDCLIEARNGERVTLLAARGEKEELLALFAQVAQEQGWRPGAQLSAEMDRSICFALTIKGVLAGGLQLFAGEAGRPLACCTTWPELTGRDLCHTAHVSVLALAREYRGCPEHFWRLGVEMWRYCALAGLTEIWLEATPRMLRLYQRIGWPLEIIGELRPHWGEECYLCAMNTGTLASLLVDRAAVSAFHRRLVRQGLRAESQEPWCSDPEDGCSQCTSPPQRLPGRNVALPPECGQERHRCDIG